MYVIPHRNSFLKQFVSFILFLVCCSAPCFSATDAEDRAMGATVRIRVEDAGGFSTATGTVIQSVNGFNLVVTCGHVFRDSGGKGKITADLNWSGELIKVDGRLLSYDAGPNDVGLMYFRSDFNVVATGLAPSDYVVRRGDSIFSIGCDFGKPPTIRRSTIKRLAVYDGSAKYDIVGRPVIGRSGGGLFNARGNLIGVCNAATVDVDEGVYSSLANIYRQLAITDISFVSATIPPGFITYEQLYDEMNVSEVWTDGDYYVIVTATWCAPCGRLKELIKTNNYFGRRIALVDLDAESSLARRLVAGRTQVPQLIRYRISHKNGKPVFDRSFYDFREGQPSVEDWIKNR